MYLKALEIQGFKSFPDKTVLQFGEDITAIVGPNGSGKSNISDAICWVMGEQSARTLRGSHMEDVIFSGAEKRSAVGFAQVTLVLDNSGGIFPSIDASEIMVTRRYYRSGESEYYINKQSVRLRDVSDLFMDTGLGKEGYSMIGQGRIDEILSVRGTDRREVFEEAAGISRYRHRKEETERKLSRTEENLVRINDKIAELELQVGPLREQAEKAKRFLILRDELRVLEISVWLDKLAEIQAAAVRLRTETAAAQEKKEKAEAQLDALYRENETFSRQVQESDIEQERVRGEQAEWIRQAQEKENAAALLETEARHRKESIVEWEVELEKQASRSRDVASEITAQQKQAHALDDQIAELENALADFRQRADTAIRSAGSAGEALQALRAREEQARDAAAKGRERLSFLSAAREQMTARQQAVTAELAAARLQRDAALENVRTARHALEAAREEADATANVIQGHTLRVAGREKRQQTAESACMRLTMEQNNMDARIHMLTEMEREYEGFSKAVREVMRCTGRGGLRGIHGPVANLMETDSRYAVALETALGQGTQNIVVDREEDAKAAIACLKQRNAGRATFLPLTAIRGDELHEKDLEAEPGFVGIASRLIRYAPAYDRVFKNLLGRTVAVEDLDAGIAMARKYQHRFRIVTLDGQIIHRGGSMTGGSVSQSAGVLSRANELSALRKNREALETALGNARRTREDAQRELDAARYALETAEGQRRAAEDAVLEKQGELRQYETLLERLTASVGSLAEEDTVLSVRLRENREEDTSVQAAIAAHMEEAAARRKEMEEKLAGQMDLQAVAARMQEEMNARKEILAAQRAQRAAMETALERMEQTQREQADDRAARERRLRQYQDAITAAEADISARQAEALSLRAAAHDRQERLKELQEGKLQLEQRRNAMGQRLKACNEVVLDAERETARLEQKLNAGVMEEKQILDKLYETYELGYTAAMEQRIELESTAKANRRIGELKRWIGALGNVNVGAIEEFDRVNTRYSYFTDQRDDVEKAKNELLGIIRQLTKEMTGIFREQFQRINTSFQETFVDLFGGGKAALVLEDPEDILNCGIEIRVQPPGKTLKTLSLLSGGEKAFVAIALYFAILKVHPTPFCVMDEIEAALDEANVVRYARYMRSLADKTQFIVITHRRGTMEEADVLYGITMQEKGVSKCLSINLNNVSAELQIKA